MSSFRYFASTFIGIGTGATQNIFSISTPNSAQTRVAVVDHVTITTYDTATTVQPWLRLSRTSYPTVGALLTAARGDTVNAPAPIVELRGGFSADNVAAAGAIVVGTIVSTVHARFGAVNLVASGAGVIHTIEYPLFVSKNGAGLVLQGPTDAVLGGGALLVSGVMPVTASHLVTISWIEYDARLG